MIWHSQPLSVVLKELNTNDKLGLTTEQVQEARKKYGKNTVVEKPIKSFWKILKEHLFSPLLVISVLVSLLTLGIDLYSIHRGILTNWIIPVIMIGLVVLCAFVQSLYEKHAEKTIFAVRQLLSSTAKVIRDGETKQISAIDLVPGDIVYIEEGDLVPADLRLLRASILKLDESCLTGEILPTLKKAEVEIPNITPLSKRENMAYSGCTVEHGKAYGVVVDIGQNTEIGKISTMNQKKHLPFSSLLNTIPESTQRLILIGILACIAIFVIGLLYRLNWLDMLLTVSALAASSIPLGLVATTTITLAKGVKRMSRRKTIVRNPQAIETLGKTTVICTDKTGTMTQGKMTLERCFVDGQIYYFDDIPNRSVSSLVQMATLCSEASLKIEDGKEIGTGHPSELTVLSYAAHHKMEKDHLLGMYPKVGEIPYDSERKRMTTIHMMENQKMVIVKGSLREILPLCTENVATEQIMAANKKMGKDALRIMAIAYKYIDDIPAHITPRNLEYDLTFGGLIGMIDPPRKEVVAAIKQCQEAGIDTVMITGDHINTAVAIGKRLNLIQDETEAISGEEVAKMPDIELIDKIRRFRVYAGLASEDKLRVLKAWQAVGATVTITGESVADAPVLKAADVGCVRGTFGTDVAKNASDMVFADESFTTIFSAVRHGRGVYANMRKVIKYILTCGMSQILLVLIGLLLSKNNPLFPIHLLFLSAIISCLPTIALMQEPAEKSVMNKKPRSNKEGLFSHALSIQSFGHAILILAVSLGAYLYGCGKGIDGLPETLAFLTLGFSQILQAFTIRTEHILIGSRIYRNPFLFVSSVLSVVLLVLVCALPVLQPYFATVTLTSGQWALAAGLSVIPFFLMEVIKIARFAIQYFSKN